MQGEWDDGHSGLTCSAYPASVHWMRTRDKFEESTAWCPMKQLGFEGCRGVWGLSVVAET